jgi:hypothetical protein
MSVELTLEEQEFINRYLSGEGANADTEWRARFMMRDLLGKMLNGQKNPQPSKLRALIESILLRLPGTIPVSAETTDEALANEIIRLLRVGLTAQKELGTIKRASNMQAASNNPTQQRSLSNETYQSSLPPSLLQPDAIVKSDPNPFEDFMTDFALNAQKPNGIKL